MSKLPIMSFYTLGCRLNQAEEEKLRRQVAEAGCLVSEPKNADFCIVNTCSVTAVADRKSHQAIKRLKNENCKLKIIVIGCGAEIAKDYPEVDLWVENGRKENLLEIVNSKFEISNQVGNSKLKHLKFNKNLELKIKNSSARTRALLKIEDGCNNFCAYCIVPHLRGREVSVSVEEALGEAKKLEVMGYKELVLSGVNVGKYSSFFCYPERALRAEGSRKISPQGRDDNIDLVELIKLILKETDFPRIRLSSINPQDITDEMIELWAKEPRLCRHFHLSLQSGSTSVLKRMGRPYTAEAYLKLSKKIVQKIPEMAITTDVIVGFPGETDKEFQETAELIRAAKLAKLHVFRYSKRAGTRAAEMPDQVSDTVKTNRSKIVLNLGQELEKEFKERFLGKEMEVLFEENKNGFWYGLTTNYIRIKHKSEEDLANRILKVRLKKDNLL